MKIEKVSENQLKLTLTKADLVERDISLEDLIHPTEKAQLLFRDIMEQALDEYDFIAENTPLMVEAVPVGMDGIMIIVTKVSGRDGGTEGDGSISHAYDLRRWKKKPLDTLEHQDAENADILIYSFPTLDDAIHASIRLDESWRGDSGLYKNQGKYFLVLQGDTYTAEESTDDLEMILREYGQKHISTPLAKYYLLEHGETIIGDKAVKALAKTFGE